MGFEKSGDGPMKWTTAVVPASPTPSYQTASSTTASSSSNNSPAGTNSYYGASSASSTSTTTSPTSPYCWNHEEPHTPPVSPGSPMTVHTNASYTISSSGGTAAAYDADLDDSYWQSHSPVANTRALQLLNEAVEANNNSTTSTQLKALQLFDQTFTGSKHRDVLANDGTCEVQAYKSHSDLIQQQMAHRRALRMVERVVQHQQPKPQHHRITSSTTPAADLSVPSLHYLSDKHGNLPHSSEEGEDEYFDHHESHCGGAEADDDIKDMKSDIDKIRQRGANLRALNLLNITAAGDKYKPLTDDPRPTKQQVSTSHGTGTGNGTGGLTARQAANLNYEKRKKEKMEVKAKLKKDLEMYGRRVPKIAVPTRKETLAESTRKKKQATADDVKDPETVSGMKCQLHWEREKEAQAKALRLLNEGYMS